MLSLVKKLTKFPVLKNKRIVAKNGNEGKIKPKNIVSVNGFDIEASRDSLLHSFLVDQYSYDNIIKAKEGDVVFDAGAYVGDTALWFCKAVGPQGKVYAFEPEPRNFAKLKANLERNKVTNVIPLQLALSETEGGMQVASGGNSSTITQTDTGTSVKVTTIDKFVEANKLPRVDFIKMDVEGHELKVLAGASGTIRTFKPSLALSAYHRGDDLISAPNFIMHLDPQYRFYLNHCSPDWRETVLYAKSTSE